MSTDTLDPSAVSLPDLGAIPDIMLDHDIVDESQPYLGVIIVDEYQPNRNADGYEWNMYVRPVDFIVKGELGCFFNRARPTTQVNSKMMKTLEALQKVFGKTKHPVGKGHLRGKVGVFVNRTLNFGVGSDGTEIKSRVILAVRKPNDEELARAQGIVDAVAAGNLTVAEPSSVPISGVSPTPSSPPAYSDADLQAMLGVIDGKTPSEFQMAALSSGLPAPLMNAILSGSATKALRDAGLVTQDSDNRVSRA